MINYIIYSKSQYNDIETTESNFNNDKIIIVKKYFNFSLDNCWAKLNKYYFKFDFNSIYTIFIVLHSNLYSIISYTSQYSCIFIGAMMLCQAGKPVLTIFAPHQIFDPPSPTIITTNTVISTQQLIIQ
jgi:hypothetical protein